MFSAYTPFPNQTDQFAFAAWTAGDKLRVVTYKKMPEDAPDAMDGIEVAPAWSGLKVRKEAEVFIDIAEARTWNSWADHCVWSGNGRFFHANGLPTKQQIRYWRNMTAESYNTKAFAGVGVFDGLVDSPLDNTKFLLFVPFADSSLDQCGIHFEGGSSEMPNLVNDEPVTIEGRAIIVREAVMPKLQLVCSSGIKANEAADFHIQLLNPDGSYCVRDCTVYVQSSGGYLPMQAIKVSGGAGQGRIVALHNQPGDAIKLKAGWKYFTAADSLEIKVV